MRFPLRFHGYKRIFGKRPLGCLTAVKASTTPEDFGVPKWNFGKADWQKFRAACDHTLGSFSISLDYAYCLFETSVRELALEAIPQSKRSIKITVPWWNKQYDIAVKNKKHAFNRMKRTWLLRDIIIFKRGRAMGRRVILEAKSSSWRQFCTSLTSTTNLSKVWKVIKSFSGNRPLDLFHHCLHKAFRLKINNRNPTYLQTNSLYPVVRQIIHLVLLTCSCHVKHDFCVKNFLLRRQLSHE